jgi:NAD-dependent deacetylase sirtuin 5
MVAEVEEWIQAGPVDLILIIGTSLNVWPAADYVELARESGARAAIVNTNRDDEPPKGLRNGDWFFHSDAAAIVPQMLKGVIGDMNHLSLPS